MYIGSRTYEESRVGGDHSPKVSRSSRNEIVERCAIAGLILVAITVVGIASISHEFSRKEANAKNAQPKTTESPKSADFVQGMQFLTDNDHGAAFASFTRELAANKNSVEAMIGRGVALANKTLQQST